MKISYKKLIALALLVCAILCLCAVTAAAVEKQPRALSGYTKHPKADVLQSDATTESSVDEGYCVAENRGYLSYNAGYVWSNGMWEGDYEYYTVNLGKKNAQIFANYGVVEYNQNRGIIQYNGRKYMDMTHSSGTIPEYLLATVGINSAYINVNVNGGIVETNAAAGEIASNGNGGIVQNNQGTIASNYAGGLVEINQGTISENSGASGNGGREANGTVQYNYPKGKVLNCSGIVEYNFGTVEGALTGAYIINNYTGFDNAASISNAMVLNSYYEVRYLDGSGNKISLSPTSTDFSKTVDGKSYSIKRAKPIRWEFMAGTYYQSAADTITIEATDGGCFSVTGGSVRNAEKNASGLYTKATITASSLVTVQFYCHTHEESCSGGEHTFQKPLTGDKFPVVTTVTLKAGDYYLAEDIYPHCKIKISGAVSICLNGHIVSGGNLGEISSLFYSDDSGSSLTIYDCGTTTHYYTVNSDGTWTLDDSSKTNAINYEALTERPKTGDVIAISGGALTMGSGYTIETNPIRYGGGAICCMAGSVTIYGGNLVGNRAHRGGAVFVKTGSSFTMYGGRICGNCATMDQSKPAKTAMGGGVCIWHQEETASTVGSFALYGGDISFNTAARFGGGVVTYGQFNMSGGLISNNYSDCGGGIDLCGGNNDPAIPSALFTGGRIVNNTAKTSGGGVYFWESATPTLGGTIVISGNTSGTTPTADNLYLKEGKTFAIGTGDAAPATGMRVGVTAADPAETVVISKSYAASLIATDFFFSDSDRQLYDLPDTDGANRKLGFSVCRLNTAKTDGSFALSLPIKSDAIIMIAGYDKDGKLTGLVQKKISAKTIDGQVTPTFDSADTVRFFLLSESSDPLCEALDATS